MIHLRLLLLSFTQYGNSMKWKLLLIVFCTFHLSAQETDVRKFRAFGNDDPDAKGEKNKVGEVIHLGDINFPWVGGTGFGLGFSVLEDLGRRGTLGTIGEYGWGGAYNSTYWVDPAEELVLSICLS